MSQVRGPLLAWAAAYLAVEMPEPLSREGVVAGLGQGVARDSPGAPAARAQEHSLVKAFVLDLPHSGGWAPMVPCVSVYLCVCVCWSWQLVPERDAPCAWLEMGRWARVWDSVPCRKEMACPWGPTSETPRLVSS